MVHKSGRRQFLGGAGALALSGLGGARLLGQPRRVDAPDFLLVNGKIHTMDANNRVVSQALIENGRFTAVGNRISAPRMVRRVDLKGRTAIPGLIDAHNHIVLVGNRPGWHTPLEHVFTIPDAVAALKARSMEVPAGEFITTVGPIAAMQFEEKRLPNLMELDAVNRPVFIIAAQGGTRANTQGKMWFEAKGITVGADGTIAGNQSGVALQ